MSLPAGHDPSEGIPSRPPSSPPDTHPSHGSAGAAGDGERHPAFGHPAAGHPLDERRDAQAALDSYLEMGPQWQKEVVDSFMTRVDAVTAQRWQESEYVRQQRIIGERAAEKARTRELVLTLVFAIPLTGIASTAGLLGMIVCWAGIAAVLFAIHSPSREQHRPRELGH